MSRSEIVSRVVSDVSAAPDGTRFVTVEETNDEGTTVETVVRMRPVSYPRQKDMMSYPVASHATARIDADMSVNAGYDCLAGKCTKVAGGQYPTIQECQNHGCDHRFRGQNPQEPIGWRCGGPSGQDQADGRGCAPVYFRDRRTGSLFQTKEDCLKECACGGSIMLFAGKNHQGRRQTLVAGRYRINDLVGCRSRGMFSGHCRPLDDAVSSILIPRGMKVRLYEHDDFTGRVVELKNSVLDLSTLGFNDLASSIDVLDDEEFAQEVPCTARQKYVLSGVAPTIYK